MAERTLHAGRLRSFHYWSESESAVAELENWLASPIHTEDDRSKLARLLKNMGEHSGIRLHPSSEKYNHEFDKIYAIKSYQIRLYGFLRKTDFVIISYEKKKRDDLSRKTRKAIAKKYDQYLNRK